MELKCIITHIISVCVCLGFLEGTKHTVKAVNVLQTIKYYLADYNNIVLQKYFTINTKVR